MQANQFIKHLYQVVDEKSLDKLSPFLADQVNFKLANFPITRGKAAVLEANKTFFNSIQSMQHRLDNIWQVEDRLICHGEVSYIRLDKTKTSANFATILKVEEDKIIDYLVYADLSQL